MSWPERFYENASCTQKTNDSNFVFWTSPHGSSTFQTGVHVPLYLLQILQEMTKRYGHNFDGRDTDLTFVYKKRSNATASHRRDSGYISLDFWWFFLHQIGLFISRSNFEKKFRKLSRKGKKTWKIVGFESQNANNSPPEGPTGMV